MSITVSDKWRENYAFYYTENISEWRRLGAIDKAANIMRLCSTYPHDTVLEIGCGEGAIIQRLLDCGFGESISGLEISPSAIAMLSKRGLKGRLFDGYAIPPSQGHVDLGILSHVVEHLEFPRRLLYEASRICDFLFVEVPLEDTARLADNYVFDRVGHINFYSRKTIRRLLQTCELEILGEYMSHGSASVYRYEMGKTAGTIKHAIKESFLRTVPKLATGIFTYHYSAMCKVPSLGVM